MTLMNREHKQEKGSGASGKVVVAVKASKEIPKSALVWALTHVVQPGDCMTLLVVVPSQSSGRKLWGLPRFAGDCTHGHKKSHLRTSPDKTYDITDSCSQMILQLHDVYDPDKIKIISGSPIGVLALEAKRAQASWIVLDKQLKNEEKRCMEELQCNIVVMKHSQPKVLRLSLVGLPKNKPEVVFPLCSDEGTENNHGKKHSLHTIRGPLVIPNSSPELGTPFTATEAGSSSVSNSGQGTSSFFISEMIDLEKEESLVLKEKKELDCASSDSDCENVSVILSTSMIFQPWMIEFINCHYRPMQHENRMLHRSDDKLQESTSKILEQMLNNRNIADFSGNVREAVSLSKTMPLGPPPLCSICQHRAPVFGKSPRWFSYTELELATGGFSQANFLAEGGFGSVHRGVLPDGLAVAVKQHKLSSSQGDLEFCSEVEILSCTQHRNVVMLIGYCVEDKRRLLVYEYICNGSLDSHLYGPLEWSARKKIAVGAGRGLRYLHEECRAGCIVHCDMRPNNILITHDFEPLVGDFGLARWQPDGDKGVETRVMGTFGYLAPEYAQRGQITEKADVYSFGVVLAELITGRKAVELNRPNGQQWLTEWSRALLEDLATDDLIDPRLRNAYSEREVYCMLHAASLCIQRDPNARPRMSQVLRILEVEMVVDGNYMLTPAQGGMPKLQGLDGTTAAAKLLQ